MLLSKWIDPKCLNKYAYSFQEMNVEPKMAYLLTQKHHHLRLLSLEVVFPNISWALFQFILFAYVYFSLSYKHFSVMWSESVVTGIHRCTDFEKSVVFLGRFHFLVGETFLPLLWGFTSEASHPDQLSEASAACDE